MVLWGELLLSAQERKCLHNEPVLVFEAIFRYVDLVLQVVQHNEMLQKYSAMKRVQMCRAPHLELYKVATKAFGHKLVCSSARRLKQSWNFLDWAINNSGSRTGPTCVEPVLSGLHFCSLWAEVTWPLSSLWGNGAWGTVNSNSGSVAAVLFVSSCPSLTHSGIQGWCPPFIMLLPAGELGSSPVFLTAGKNMLSLNPLKFPVGARGF